MFVCIQVRMNSAVQFLLLPPHYSSAFIFAFLPHHLSFTASFNTLSIILLFSFLAPLLFPLSSSSPFSPSFILAVLLLLHALFYLPPMCVIPSPLLPSNNSVQIPVRHWVPKYSIYQYKYKINTHPIQTQHTGSSADLPMTLAHALQLSSVLTELRRQKNAIFGHLLSAETKDVCRKSNGVKCVQFLCKL